MILKIKTVLLTLPLVCFLLSGFLLFPSSGRDDAHITYWSAYALLEFGDILNYNGYRLEQSSSLLHVLFLSTASKLSYIPVEYLGKPFSILWGALSIIIFYFFSSLVNNKINFSAVFFASTTPYFIYWSFGGLETSLVVFTSIIAIMSFGKYLSIDQVLPKLKDSVFIFISLLLLTLVRPEMPIIILTMLLGSAFFFIIRLRYSTNNQNYIKIKQISFLLLNTLLISGAIFILRKLYFGEILPQPVLAKSDGISLIHFHTGFQYFLQSFLSPGIFSIIIAILFFLSLGYISYRVVAKSSNQYLFFSLGYTLTYICFIFASGGDWMEGGRFFVPIIPFLCLFLSITLHSLLKKIFVIPMHVLIIILNLGFLLQFSDRYSTSLPIWDKIEILDEYQPNRFTWFERNNRVNSRDLVAIHYLDKTVKDLLTVQNNVTIFSAQMGIVPYYITKDYYGKVRWYDMFSLADNTFTTCIVTEGLSKSAGGMYVPYEYYFEKKKEINEICDIPQPDIIYDLTLYKAKLSEENGYTVIFMQTGWVVGESSLYGENISADSFIAIKNELVNIIEPKVKFITYDEIKK